ncbi:hypothetical protein [Pseudidiomarina woesei]|uniref:Lipoprotein n=1 Tax=Pseudidiomarina woesei TaxID=1381080 RepID=A0A0K6H7A1_9GAMM|nr:hypothetical protein [Pseudidiomarina woesei]CUA86710.1 hypothetical protein Ga0061064_1588 [Pseudidiomarina woesei]
MIKPLICIVLLMPFLVSCGTTELNNDRRHAYPWEIIAPTPIPDNSGNYMVPFTSDGVLAEWVNAHRSGQIAGALGGSAASLLAASQDLGSEAIPFVGAFVSAASKAAQRNAIQSATGGAEGVRAGSDLSFNELTDLMAWMYATHSLHPNFDDIVQVLDAVYPGAHEKLFKVWIIPGPYAKRCIHGTPNTFISYGNCYFAPPPEYLRYDKYQWVKNNIVQKHNRHLWHLLDEPPES